MGSSQHKILINPDHVLVERPDDYEVVLDETPAMLKQISAACQQSECNRVLVIGGRTKVSLSQLDVFDLGQQIAELGVRIAIVESHDAPRNRVEFLEDVTTNRGGPIKFFDNQDDAKVWLGVH